MKRDWVIERIRRFQRIESRINIETMLKQRCSVSIYISRLNSSPIVNHRRVESRLLRRRNLTWVSNACEAAPRSLFWAPNGLNELPEVCCKFPFILIGQSIMAFLTVQSWRVLKSWYTGGGPGQGFRRGFADAPNQSFVSSGVQAKWKVVIDHSRKYHNIP